MRKFPFLLLLGFATFLYLLGYRGADPLDAFLGPSLILLLLGAYLTLFEKLGRWR